MNSSSQVPAEMEYIKYFNLGFGIAIVMFNVTTIFFTSYVIYCSKFDKKSAKLDRISNSFFIFLASRGFGAVLATPYYVYLTVYWSAEGGRNYEPYAHLWLGLGSIIYAFLSPVSALLLTIERCFALAVPFFYKFHIVKWFPWLTLTCFLSSSIFAAFYVVREIPLDVEKVHNCQYLPCVLLKYRFLVPQYAKFGVGILNVLGSCYLIRAIKWNTSEKLKNDVVILTITMDIFLDVIPAFASFVFVTITGFSPTVYIGQLILFLAFLNVAVCSVYYSWRLTRKRNWFWIKSGRVEPDSPATTVS